MTHQPQDKNDANMDRVLRSVSTMIDLPDEPGEDRIRAWKSSTANDGALRRRGATFMKRHKLITIAGAGSAIAAVVALSTFLSTNSSNAVAAATVFNGFRQAIGQAFSIRFENVVTEGIRADGEMFVTFDEADTERENPRTVSVDLKVRDTQFIASGQGLDARIAFNVDHDGAWVYAQANQLPAELLKEQPLLILFSQMLRDGVLLDLESDGLLGLINEDEIDPTATAGEMKVGVHADLSPDSDDAVAPATKLTLNLSAGVNDEKTAAAESVGAESNTEIAVRSQGFTFQVGGQNEADDSILGNDGAVAEVLRSVVSGKASPEQLDLLVAVIENTASNVEVHEDANGLTILSASGFKVDGADLSPESAKYMEKLVVRIAYRPGVGVPWAAFENVGDANGTIRFETTPAGMKAPVLNREQFIVDGKTRVIDLEKLSAQLSGIFESAAQDDAAGE